MERRNHSRLPLKTPLECLCRIGLDAPLQCTVMDISILGMRVEVHGLSDGLMVECRQRVAVEERDRGEKYLIPPMVGTMKWVYQNFIGIRFDHPIKPSTRELASWLEAHGQLSEAASKLIFILDI